MNFIPFLSEPSTLFHKKRTLSQKTENMIYFLPRTHSRKFSALLGTNDGKGSNIFLENGTNLIYLLHI